MFHMIRNCFTRCRLYCDSSPDFAPVSLAKSATGIVEGALIVTDTG